jgi:hypothetical protein
MAVISGACSLKRIVSEWRRCLLWRRLICRGSSQTYDMDCPGDAQCFHVPVCFHGTTDESLISVQRAHRAHR